MHPQPDASGTMPDWQPPADDSARFGRGGDLQPGAVVSAAWGQERFRIGQGKEADQSERGWPQVGTVLGRGSLQGK